MKRIHISKNPNLVFDPNFKYTKIPDLFKPEGLWYGIDGAWKEWVKENQQDWMWPYEYEVLVDKTNLLVVNAGNMTEFMDEFGFLPEYLKGLDFFQPRYMEVIDWNRVKEKYDGIEFNPYHRNLFNDPMWWTTIDCDSGCVWRNCFLERG